MHVMSRMAAACLLIAVGGAQAADSEQLDDLVARVQFDAYATDTRALRADLNAMARLEVDGELSAQRQYFLAYGRWKLAEALLAGDRAAAKRAAEQCGDALDPILDVKPPRSNAMPAAERERWFDRRAEALAIAAGCRWTVAEASYLPGSEALGGIKVDKTLDEALALRPKNPRVRFVDAMLSLRRASDDAERNRAQAKLTAVVDAFDAQPPAELGAVDWGHAEALTYLGQAYLANGNRIAARNALERALVLAPDFSHAKALLKQALTAQ